LARALGIRDTASTRELLEEARANSPLLLWAGPQLPKARVLASSDDGEWVALKTDSGVEVWSANKHVPTREIRYSGDIQFAKFSPDGRIIAIAQGKNVVLWDISANTNLALRMLNAPFDVTSLGFSPDGQLVIVGCLNGDILIWDVGVDSPEPRLRLHGHRDRVTATAVSEHQRILISGSWDDTVKVWNLTDGTELKTLFGHEDSVLCVALNTRGDLIASAGWDDTIIIWDLESGRKLHALEGHKAAISAVAFSKDGNWIASGSEDRTVRLWDVTKGKHIMTLPGYGDDVTSISFVPSEGPGRLVSGTASGDIRIWDLSQIGQRDELTTLRGHSGAVTMFAFDPRKSQLISASVDHTIRIWDLENRNSIQLPPTQLNNVSAIEFSPDGHQFAWASREPAVHIWDMDAGTSKVLTAAESDQGIRYIAYSPDGKLLAAGSDDGRIRVWNVLQRTLLTDYLAHSQKIQGLEFSPNGELLASSSDDAGIKLWRVMDWTMVHELIGHRSGVYQIAFSPDGNFLLSTSDDKTARLWAVGSGKEVIEPIQHDSPVWTANFSPDGTMIATGSEDATVQIWDFVAGGRAPIIQNHRVLRVSAGPVWWLAFKQRADGLLLGLGGQDRTIHIVNLSLFESLSTTPEKLEEEAEFRSGLLARTRGNEPELAPMTPYEFTSRTAPPH